MILRWLGCCALLAAVSATGCGGGKGSVSGTVKFKGEPLPGGQVTFASEAGDKPVVNSGISADGKYKVESLPAGSAQVGVKTIPPPPKAAGPMQGKGLDPSLGGGAAATPGKYVPIPTKYADPTKSGLKCTVVGGKESNFDIDLQP